MPRLLRAAPLLTAAATAVAALAAAAAAAGDAPTILVNQGIGSARMGESQIQVALDYGSFCFHGCAGKVTIGELGLTTIDYRVTGGDLVVVLRLNRVAVLRTTSARYRTASGIGVGSAVRTTTGTWNGFRRLSCAGGTTVWVRSGTTVVTRLHTAGGVVKSVELRLRALPHATTC